MPNHETEHLQAPHAEHSAHFSSNAISEFVSSIYDGSIGTPLHLLKQTVGIESNTAQKPELHGSMRVAQVAGETAGALLDIAVLSKLGACAFERAGAAKVVLGEGTLLRISKAEAAAEVPTAQGMILYKDRFPTSYRVYGNRAELDYNYAGTQYSGTFRSIPDYSQYKIGNERGILVHNGEARVVQMPAQIDGVGKFTYLQDKTVLENEHGTFVRDLTTGRMQHQGTVNEGGWGWKFGNGERYEVEQSGAYNIQRIAGYDTHFDSSRRLTHAIDTPGKNLLWSFEDDGSISMEQKKFGQASLEIKPDGSGTYRAWPSEEGTPMTYDPKTNKIGNYDLPDRSPMPGLVEERINQAKAQLEKLTVPLSNERSVRRFPIRSEDPNHVMTAQEYANYRKARDEGTIAFYKSLDWDHL